MAKGQPPHQPSNGSKYPQINTNTMVSLGTILTIVLAVSAGFSYVGNIKEDVTRLETRTTEREQRASEREQRTTERISTLEGSVKDLKTDIKEFKAENAVVAHRQSEQINEIKVRLTRIEIMLSQALGVRNRTKQP